MVIYTFDRHLPAASESKPVENQKQEFTLIRKQSLIIMGASREVYEGYPGIDMGNR